MVEISSNDPCPCGSGKEYKQCCQQREASAASGRIAAAAIPATLQAALEHHRGGRLPQARAIYRQILEADPHHADALHYLGAIASHEGKYRDAADLIGRAIRIRPSRTMHYNLGNALKALGDLDGAAENYRQALALKPDYAEAHVNLGNVLQAQGKLDEAVGHYRSALSIKPGYAEAHCSLGNIFHTQGKLGEAVESYRHALILKPDLAQAHYNMGNALYAQGKLDEAAESFRRTIALRPDFAGAHNNLGNALDAQGKVDAAIECHRKALVLRPDFAEAHVNLGNALKELGRLDEAITSYQRALAVRPDLAEAHLSLGNALREQGSLDGAIAQYHKALAFNPDYADAYNNLGDTLKEQGRLDEAVICCRKALALQPDFAGAHNNLGNALNELGKVDEAVESLQRALALRPDLAEAHLNMGNALLTQGKLGGAIAQYHKALALKPGYAMAHNNLGNTLRDQCKLDEAVDHYRQAFALKPDYAETYSNLLFALNYHPDLSAEAIYEAYREYDARHGIPLKPTWRAHLNDRNPQRRLRVGYVSPDFRQHTCSYFMESLLARHDKTQVEVYAYAEIAAEDDLTARYKSYVEHWIPTKGMGDDALAERIRSDGIDILVDLAGHTNNNRLPVFARKPAPVSLSWMGYGYTTGLGAIDYYLTDEASVPPGSEGLFAEQPWRIATPAYVYRPHADMGEVGSLPAQQRGYVTFGTLSRSVRINHRTIRVWADLLKAVPGSRLVIDSRNFNGLEMQEQVAARFAEHGIMPERLEIGYHSPPWDVLRGLDIGLDCFPHNSGTTLFESLYMGVPYITLAERPSVGRLGSSILHGAGHPEWIAGNEAEYVAKAANLANNVALLAGIRATLRDQMLNGPLMDEEGFARKVENAYRSMWKIWCEKDDKTVS